MINMTIDIHHALENLYPDGAKYIQEGNNYSGLKWVDARPKPTRAEIDVKIAELQAQYDANEYQRQRASEYPSWQDQLDKIYHEGIDAWKAEIKAIKDANPKG